MNSGRVFSHPNRRLVGHFKASDSGSTSPTWHTTRFNGLLDAQRLALLEFEYCLISWNSAHTMTISEIYSRIFLSNKHSLPAQFYAVAKQGHGIINASSRDAYGRCFGHIWCMSIFLYLDWKWPLRAARPIVEPRTGSDSFCNRYSKAVFTIPARFPVLIILIIYKMWSKTVESDSTS